MLSVTRVFLASLVGFMRVFKIILFCLTAGVFSVAGYKVDARTLTGFDYEGLSPEEGKSARDAAPPASEPKPALSNPLTGPFEQLEKEMPVALPPSDSQDVSSQTQQKRFFLTGPRQARKENVLSNPGAAKDVETQAARNTGDEEAPVDLEADDLVYDDAAQIVEAIGNVRLEQAGRVVEADKISYALAQNRVVALGDVRLRDRNGDLHFANYVELKDDLKDGVIRELRSVLIDGSRFTAATGSREGAVRTVMQKASYTPCEPCETDPDAAPPWQIKAGEVEYDEEESRIHYRHARFEFYGIPLFYTPYFSHFDSSVTRKSGLLQPTAGFKSDLGVFIRNSYYWDISPQTDATASLQLHTRENPLLLGEVRQNWDNADLEIDGGITYSRRRDREAGQLITQEDEVRGHFFAEGLWDINEKWRSGLDISLVSDDQYLRQYDISGEDVLENEIYAERFSGRNYASARIITFQDLRLREQQLDQPEVIPEMQASFIGEPGSVPVLGGRWEADASFLGLRREGEQQDINRISGGLGWQRRLVSDTGLLTTTEAHLRGDFYSIRDRTAAFFGSGRSQDVTESRIFPYAHIQTSYPMVRPFETFQARIEPMAALTLAHDVDRNNIPNEDSQDVQIDTTNLFNANRFPGLDAVEDESRVTYGLRSGLYSYDGSYLRAFAGQSSRLSDNPRRIFPIGSGLEEPQSDIVAELNAAYSNRYFANYKLQLDYDTLSSQRHEFDFFADMNRLTLGGRYLFAKGLAGTDITESREQSQLAAAFDLTEDWRTRGGAIYDFGADPGLREAYLGLDYFGQCLSWSLTGERNLTSDASGESSTEILLRIGLKNLGDFETSGFEGYLEDDLRP